MAVPSSKPPFYAEGRLCDLPPSKCVWYAMGMNALKKWSCAIFHVQSNVWCVHSCSGLACGSILKGRLPFPIFPPSESLICIYETCGKKIGIMRQGSRVSRH